MVIQLLFLSMIFDLGKSTQSYFVTHVLCYRMTKIDITQSHKDTGPHRQINGDPTHLGLRLEGSKVVRVISWIFLRDLPVLCPVVFWLDRLSGDFPPASLRFTTRFRSEDRDIDMASSSSSSSSSSCSPCVSIMGG